MRRTFLSLCLAGFLSALASAPAAAATLRIEFDDFDVAFDGYELTDGNSVDSGQGFKADALRTMDFFLDDVHLGRLTSNIFADMSIGVTDPIPVSGGDVEGYFGYMDLYTNDAFDAGLRLALFNIDLIFNPIGQPTQNPRLALAGFATGLVLSQALAPFNVEFDPDASLDVLFIVSLENIKTNDNYVTSFTGEGLGKVQGDANVVPEPTSMLLLGTGLLGAVAARRRASRNAQAA